MTGNRNEPTGAAPVRVRTHRVAMAAYEAVERRRANPDRKAYGALAHKLPGLILQNGLAQATGFLLAKGKAEHQALLEDLRHVLKAAGATTAADGPALHRAVIAADLTETLALTRRALDASGWLKRYVQGILRIDATGETTDPEHGNGQ